MLLRHLTPEPKNRREALRWINKGIEIYVIDPETDRPIDIRNGSTTIHERTWSATVVLRNGVVTKITY